MPIGVSSGSGGEGSGTGSGEGSGEGSGVGALVGSAGYSGYRFTIMINDYLHKPNLA